MSEDAKGASALRANVPCDVCSRPAVCGAVTNGDHRDMFACGRHLHSRLLDVTSDGWAKIGRIAAPDRGECQPMGTNARGVAQCSEGHGDFPDACNEATERAES